jgi:hypothetical protein
MSRDERMAKRNNKAVTEIIDVSSGNKKAVMSPEIIDVSSGNKKAVMSPEIIDVSSGNKKAVMSLEIPSIILRNDSEPDRQLVILPYEPDDLGWQIPNIVYFRSSGTSNEGCGWLCGTFFPTGGITTKIKQNKKTVGINDDCAGTEGHLLKMSDIMSGVTSVGINKNIDSFYTMLANAINVFLQFEEVRPAQRTLYITPTILDLFNAFSTYFLSEQQLLLSYRLSITHSDEGWQHIGLWGWECTGSKNKNTFKLSDFCKERWGNPSPIDIPNKVDIMNKEDACIFIKENNANVNFEGMKKILIAHNKDPKNGKPFTTIQAFGTVLQLNNFFSQPLLAKGIQKKNKITNKRKRKGVNKTIRNYGKLIR